jgi:diazepam-binding inhibitor (GABA receptor modulator, acyl-CoA-binding protein)
MGLEEDFQLAADAAKTLPESIANDDKLNLYGLFKQATIGDVNTGETQ